MALLTTTSTFAGSCEISKFLKKNAIVRIYAGGMLEEDNVKIVEIDKKACWIKIANQQYFPWINLNTIVGITPINDK